MGLVDIYLLTLGGNMDILIIGLTAVAMGITQYYTGKLQYTLIPFAIGVILLFVF